MVDILNKGKVSIEKVSKNYDTPDGELLALSDISLDIRPGEIISLVGTSGCGKSTLLRLIAGLEPPTDGALSLDDETIEGPNYSRGLVFQDATLFPWLSVKKNIAFGLKSKGIYRECKHEVDEYLSLIGMADFKNAYPHQLSGGMAQRVALARALINQPSVLLLDEPLGALDAFTRMEMQDELLNIWQAHKTTMIIVTHDVDEAVYLSDRIVVMTPRPGRISQIFDVTIPRPRNRSYPGFFDLRTQILELLHLAKQDTIEYVI